MSLLPQLRLLLAFCAIGNLMYAQIAPSKPFVPPEEKPATPPTPPPQQQQPQQVPRPSQPAPGQPAAAAPAPAQTAPTTQPQTLPPSDAPPLADAGSFVLPNASLTDMIGILARRLKLNYILDPA